MNLLGATELKTVELPDQLLFAYGYEAGWGDLAAPPAALLVALAWAAATHHYVLGAIFVVGFGALVLYWLNISPARLKVSAQELIAHNSQLRNVRQEVIVPASEIHSLAYIPAGPQGAAGLYAWHGIRQTCLMPGITPEEAAEAADLIRKKFPHLERGDNNRTALEYRSPAGNPTPA